MPPRPGRHNTGGGRQPRQLLFDTRREELFRYDAKNALAQSPLDAGQVNALLQMIVSRGARASLAEAKEFVHVKLEEKVIDEGTARTLSHLLDKYSVYR